MIASRWRAIPEIVEDGVTGLLVEPRDPVGLAEAMQQLIDSPCQLDGLAEGAAKAAQRFSSIRWTERFVELCRELSRERRPSMKRRARWQPCVSASSAAWDENDGAGAGRPGRLEAVKRILRVLESV